MLKNMIVRFFAIGYPREIFCDECKNNEPDIFEINEYIFEELQIAGWPVKYERDTIRVNGCDQVRLTVNMLEEL